MVQEIPAFGWRADPRRVHQLAPDSRCIAVLVAGGYNEVFDTLLDSTKIFVPLTNVWTPTTPLQQNGAGFQMVLL